MILTQGKLEKGQFEDFCIQGMLYKQGKSVIFFSISTTAAFTSSHGREMNSQDFDEKPQYCMTPGCVKAASEILKNMDESVNPCDDFYQFACGGFIKKTVIPDDRTRMSSFSVLSDELLEQVSFFYIQGNLDY